MIKLDEKEYIYKVRSKLRLLSAYYVLFSMIFSLIYSYYFIKKLDIPDAIIYVHLSIIILFTINIMKRAERIKSYAEEYNVDLYSEEYVKVFNKIIFFILIASLGYSFLFGFLNNNINNKLRIVTIFSLMMFSVLWINYRFLY